MKNKMFFAFQTLVECLTAVLLADKFIPRNVKTGLFCKLANQRRRESESNVPLVIVNGLNVFNSLEIFINFEKLFFSHQNIFFYLNLCNLQVRKSFPNINCLFSSMNPSRTIWVNNVDSCLLLLVEGWILLKID